MHSEIMAFLEHVSGILDTIGHSWKVLGYFRNM